MKQSAKKEQIQQDKAQRWENIKWPQTVTELHVHLGGSVPLYRLWEIAIARGIRGLGNGYEEFVNLLKRQEGKVFDLDSYLEIYDRVELIQSGPDAVRESVIIAIHRAFLDGGIITSGPGGEHIEKSPLFTISRLELRFNPLKRTGAVFLRDEHAGLYDVDRVIRSAATAVADCALGFKNKIQTGLLFCFGRDLTTEANLILARKVRDWSEQESCIIGVDLAGPESVNPLNDATELQKMKEIFDLAGKDIGRTIHVGETPHVDLKTFIQTIKSLEPTRVAHPIVACREYLEKKNKDGLLLLKERGIICELCVKSNLLTGAVKDLSEYKRVIDTFDEFEIPYTFSTDAPSLQVTSLAGELYLFFMSEDGISEEQILRSLDVAEQHSFLSA